MTFSAGPLGATGTDEAQLWPLLTTGPWARRSKAQVGDGPEVGTVQECCLEEEAFMLQLSGT